MGQTDFDFKHVYHLENTEDSCKQSLHFDQIKQSLIGQICNNLLVSSSHVSRK